MFSDQKKKRSGHADRSNEQNKIAQGTEFTGDIVAKGGFRIEGTLIGTLQTPAKVVLGKTGSIQGKVECGNADFEGKFSGELLVSETLTLRSTAIVEGEVSVERLAVEPGANFNATCAMKGSVKTLKDDRKEAEKTQKKSKKTVGA